MMALQDIIWAYTEGKREYEALMASESCELFQAEEFYPGDMAEAGCEAAAAYPPAAEDTMSGRIASGDNLAYMLYLLKQKQMAGAFQLIYADPPFLSNSKYQASVRIHSEVLGASSVMKVDAYDDLWRENPAAYLKMLTVRLFLMRELLSEQGCIWVHLDWHAAHYIKVLLDQIFGAEHFVNEIIWNYKSGGASRKSFSKKHDTLLVYGKTKHYAFYPQKEKSYNRDLKPYHFKNVEEFQDEHGWYTLVNMKDVWEIDMVGRTSGERTGYATQKPEKLLERIIASCSKEGDLCADFFAGSGTLGAVCHKQGRRWIMCDAGALATAGQIFRMANLKAEFFVERNHFVPAEESKGEKNGSLQLKSKGPREFYLSGYIPADEQAVPAAGSHGGEIIRYLEEDSLSLLRICSVDFQYDGTYHRAELVLINGARSIVLPEHAGGTIHMIAYDLWGNRVEQEAVIPCT